MIQLKNIDCNTPLETIIIQEHDLKEKGLTEDEIKTILHNSKCLLVFDGYDEYKKGTNQAIDASINGENGNCFVLITSRPDYMDKKDRKKMDEEIQIVGLSDKSITECIDRHFDNEEGPQSGSTDEDPTQAKVKSKNFIKKAEKRGVFRLLKIPILLLIVSALYVETGDLPQRRTDIMWEIVQIYIKRAEKKEISIENPDELLRHLGKLSYEASKRKTHQLMIDKVGREKTCLFQLDALFIEK